MDVSENRGTPKSSILKEFSIINHPFWGTPIFGNTHITTRHISPFVPYIHDSYSTLCTQNKSNPSEVGRGTATEKITAKLRDVDFAGSSLSPSQDAIVSNEGLGWDSLKI